MSLSSLQINSAMFFRFNFKLPQEYDLRNIPYIWGQYDEAWKQGKITEPLILLPKQTNRLIRTGNESEHSSSSAWFSISVCASVCTRAKTDKSVHLILRYGKDHETREVIFYNTSFRQNGGLPCTHEFIIPPGTRTIKNWICVCHAGDAEINLVELRRSRNEYQYPDKSFIRWVDWPHCCVRSEHQCAYPGKVHANHSFSDMIPQRIVVLQVSWNGKYYSSNTIAAIVAKKVFRMLNSVLSPQKAM